MDGKQALIYDMRRRIAINKLRAHNQPPSTDMYVWLHTTVFNYEQLIVVIIYCQIIGWTRMPADFVDLYSAMNVYVENILTFNNNKYFFIKIVFHFWFCIISGLVQNVFFFI